MEEVRKCDPRLTTTRPHYRFGPFDLDVAAGQLTRSGERVSLRPKCFDLLLFLASHPGELLSKERLLDEVWGDVVVGDATLSRTITELRDALADDPDAPLYIETVPRRGYRFIGRIVASAVPRPAATCIFVTDTRQFPLDPGEHLMGRASDVAIPVLTPLASRHHARVRVASDSVTIEDLDSRNGTYVNDERIAGRVTVRAGDRVRVAGETFIVWSPDRHDDPTADESATGN